LQVAWSTPAGEGASSPVVADGRVYVASTTTHSVRAFAVDGGEPLWCFTAGGPVDTPPTIDGDRVLFGCADGWLYCLHAADGQLAWRCRGGPRDVRMMNRGHVESSWPIHGSVLVREGVAYFAAGRSSFLDGGIYVCAVDARSGQQLRQTRIDSYQPETGDMAECRLAYDMPPEALGALPDVLLSDGPNVVMRHLAFDAQTLDARNAVDPEIAKGNRRGFPYLGGHLMAVAGLLDDAWFNQTYWTVDGRAHCKLLVFDADTAYGVKPFPGDARHSRAIFRPGTKGYTLFASQRPDHQLRWSIQVPVRVTSLLLAGSTLFVAGTPDTVEPEDPWSAIEGRAGGMLWALSTTDGKRLASYDLESPPRFDGLAAADGRLFLTCQDGRLLCFAAE
jgi:outer membrane protein assembly factor BamB